MNYFYTEIAVLAIVDAAMPSSQPKVGFGVSYVNDYGKVPVFIGLNEAQHSVFHSCLFFGTFIVRLVGFLPIVCLFQTSVFYFPQGGSVYATGFNVAKITI